MKYFKQYILLLLSLALFSACEKSSETVTTETGTVTHSKSLIKIVVWETNGLIHPGIKVVMSDSLISNLTPFTEIKSAVSDSNGIALFDMQPYESLFPKTFYFGAMQQEGNYYVLRGTAKVEIAKVNTEYTRGLVLLN